MGTYSPRTWLIFINQENEESRPIAAELLFVVLVLELNW